VVSVRLVDPRQSQTRNKPEARQPSQPANQPRRLEPPNCPPPAILASHLADPPKKGLDSSACPPCSYDGTQPPAPPPPILIFVSGHPNSHRLTCREGGSCCRFNVRHLVFLDSYSSHSIPGHRPGLSLQLSHRHIVISRSTRRTIGASKAGSSLPLIVHLLVWGSYRGGEQR
jgi:hypothetical protein